MNVCCLVDTAAALSRRCVVSSGELAGRCHCRCINHRLKLIVRPSVRQ